MSGSEQKSAERHRLVLVTGMHRSGTSAVARALNLLGVDFGEELIGPAHDNPRGFWEDRRIVEIHDSLLHAIGRPWDDPRPLPEGWLDLKPAREALEALGALLTRMPWSAPVRGIKDPRMSRLLPLWERLLQSLKIEFVTLLCVRDPQAVAASMLARNKMPLPLAC